MADSTNLQLPYLSAAQAQKHVTVNESLRLLDALVRTRVVDRDLTSSPGEPADGSVYIPASGADGAWSGWDFNLAYYVDGAWRKIVPKVGWLVYVIDEDKLYKFEGDPSYWVELSTGGGGGGGAGRELLTADRTYYVRTDGDDANDGLTDSSGGAFATLQKAVDIAAALDLGTFNVTIQIGDGTYTDGLEFKTTVGAGDIILQGSSSNPSNVLISTTSESAFGGSNWRGHYVIKKLKIETTTSGWCLLVSGPAAAVSIDNLVFGLGASSAHMRAENGGLINIIGGYEVAGAAARHVQALGNALIFGQGLTITVTGTPAFGNGFAVAQEGGFMRLANITFSGGATGKRYDATLNGIVNTNGGGADYFPGNVAGTTATGGQYA